MFIDTHAHLYSNEFDEDRSSVLERAWNMGISHILMPAIDSGTHDSMLQLEIEYPYKCLSMIGLHPCSVTKEITTELNIIKQYLKERTFIAIGESGLDFYWDGTYKDQQYIAFEQQIEWALQYNLPIVIHSRESINECISMVKKYTTKGLRGVFHCFGGSLEQAKEIIDIGFYLGIGGILTFKKSDLGNILKDLPLEHLILETDAPYLAPTPYRGKRNESSYLPLIAQKLADIKETTLIKISTLTSINAKKLFHL